jgi:nicotinamide mononucleotide transporter
MKEETFNKWFNVFILAGMSVCVVLSCLAKLRGLGITDWSLFGEALGFGASAPSGQVWLLILTAFGALFGVASTVCSANGSIWTFVFGLLDVLIYSYILLDSKNPSQFLLHVLYMVPMEFVGFFQWRKKGAGAKKQVRAQRIGSGREWLKFGGIFAEVFILASAISWFALSADTSSGSLHLVPVSLSGKILLDALITTANIVAFAMGAFAYMEQWYLWTLVNLSSIVMWAGILAHDPGASYAIIPLVKYSFYLINGINGIRIWWNLSAPAPSSRA